MTTRPPAMPIPLQGGAAFYDVDAAHALLSMTPPSSTALFDPSNMMEAMDPRMVAFSLTNLSHIRSPDQSQHPPKFLHITHPHMFHPSEFPDVGSGSGSGSGRDEDEGESVDSMGEEDVMDLRVPTAYELQHFSSSPNIYTFPAAWAHHCPPLKPDLAMVSRRERGEGLGVNERCGAHES
jgi:hypothetical protein